MAPLVKVEGLRVIGRGEGGRQNIIVKDVSFEANPGEVVALIGESGSGKTTIALSLMGYTRSGAHIVDGSVTFDGRNVLDMSSRELSGLRGRDVAYVAQSASAAFNPAHPLLKQVIESSQIHRTMSGTHAETKAISLFRELVLPNPEHVGDRYPHQVSGGQLQRLLAAMALVNDPKLVIFDEPTTALDVITQIEVLRAFKKAIKERGTTAIHVSHDLAVVAQMADRIIVLRDGMIREVDATGRILTQPKNDYTRSLLAAAEPRVRPVSNDQAQETSVPPVLQIRNVVAGYASVDREGVPAVPVLCDVNLTIKPGSTLGVIGESGCGKSTLARVIAGLLPAQRGDVLLNGAKLPASVAERTCDQLRRIQIVFQMADTALNPARPIGRILGRPLEFYHGFGGEKRRRRVAELLEMVRLPATMVHHYPSELSGGQKQRVNLARALAAEPSLILCDEVTSAVDTVVGAAILDLLADLQRELGVSYLFISHDLSTVKAVCDEVMILYAGQMMEYGSRRALHDRPLHPYSDLLISSVPELRQGWLDEISETARKEASTGEARRGPGPTCSFFERCSVRIPGRCDVEPIPLRRFSKGADVRCVRTEQELVALTAR
ncbi:peptide/nickel transport system ATP-binding protein [Bradyrhizobium sp. USDA 4532]|uniref:ABC transporter ATP-binding protein n=1 Tax=unclassified Bradyrhizobium TaxID=2631580 RepID=UPI0020A13D0A|nr:MULTISPECIES: ABC transporter ATP-binding protein [unclassified Bradyrhizobium]MCP1835627.1 peptide/nickel transport system ATP-binding protein [Bradyrhizobium sp. USDA 4545]MCP1920376.1 peptide/nickel transport system ATP-binding protein [Bradyrhizobium sp. USDA 4532]